MSSTRPHPKSQGGTSSISKNDQRISKFMSLVLRHQPDAANLTLNESGWASCQDLIHGINQKYKGRPFTMTDLERIVREDSKQRYLLSADHTLIRANQGHSLQTISIDFEQKQPPAMLYHGTSSRFEHSIQEKGLLRMNRHHVHLSSSLMTAMDVGKRHGGDLVIYAIECNQMTTTLIPSNAEELPTQDSDQQQQHQQQQPTQDGELSQEQPSYLFYLSSNNVWLVEHVPPRFLRKLSLDEIQTYVQTENDSKAS